MKVVSGTRVLVGALAAVMLVVLAMWIATHAIELGGAVSGTVTGALNSASADRLVDAVYCVGIALVAGAQVVLLREVAPGFYRVRRGDEIVVVGFGAVAAAGLVTAVVLLVTNS